MAATTKTQPTTTRSKATDNAKPRKPRAAKSPEPMTSAKEATTDAIPKASRLTMPEGLTKLTTASARVMYHASSLIKARILGCLSCNSPVSSEALAKAIKVEESVVVTAIDEMKKVGLVMGDRSEGHGWRYKFGPKGPDAWEAIQKLGV